MADRLAKEGCTMASTMTPTVFDWLPDFVINTLQMDQEGAIRYRKIKQTRTEQALDMETTTTLFAAQDDGPASTATNGVTIVENSVLSNDQTLFCTNLCHDQNCNSQLTSSTNVMHPTHHRLCSNSFIELMQYYLSHQKELKKIRHLSRRKNLCEIIQKRKKKESLTHEQRVNK